MSLKKYWLYFEMRAIFCNISNTLDAYSEISYCRSSLKALIKVFEVVRSSVQIFWKIFFSSRNLKAKQNIVLHEY